MSREGLAPGRHLSAALVAGALAGASAGLIDGVWSWRAMAQFTPDAGGRLRALVFVAASHALLGAVLAAAVAGAWLALWRGTRLGAIAHALAGAHDRARAREPREALVGLSLAIAGVPAIGGALAVAGAIAWATLPNRKHVGLVIAVSMALAIAALLAAVPLALALGRAVELALARLARGPRLARALSSPRAPLVAAVALVVVAAIAAAIATWDTLSLLRLRPLWVGVAAAALAAPALATGRRAAARLVRLRPLARAGVLLAAGALLLAAALAAGAAEPPREAAIAHTGLAGPIARVLRRAGDLDRDGFSRLLGGGDCDDGDAGVHPGADEIPDDGVDSNCVGGDVSSRPTPPLALPPLPAAVPTDLNLVLITIDTLRADHVGAYGYRRDTTPAIDAVAEAGLVFESGWAHAPSTRYSIPAILTGRYPLEVSYFDIPGQWPGLSDDNTTIAEILAVRGFETGAILNYWYFEKKRRMDQGFTHYDNTNQRLHKGIPGEGPAKTKGSSSREQTDKAIALLDQIATRRFFLWVHYYDPHFDYERHPEVPSFGNATIDLYDHEIRYTDEHVGRLIDDLRRRGLWDRTAFVITGDHGEGFGEHGIDLHGYHLYAPQTRVPLIVRVPGLAPARIAAAAGHVDILPTLAHLGGATSVAGVMGRSLVADPGDATGPVFQQLSYEGNHELRGAATERCHVIYNVSPDSSWEVYRIDTDPGEMRDLSGAPGDCEGTMSALARWYDQTEVPPGAGEALLEAAPAIDRPLDVALGDQVRLLAVDLPAAPVAAGAAVPVTFTFAARGALRGGWSVFAHFEQSGRGAARFHGDHEPPRPFAWWKDGQFIRYTRQVAVPRGARPGRYDLWVGLFRGDQRQPARGAGATRVEDDRVLVGTLEVGR